jgi:hypothetical protein
LTNFKQDPTRKKKYKQKFGIATWPTLVNVGKSIREVERVNVNILPNEGHKGPKVKQSFPCS